MSDSRGFLSPLLRAVARGVAARPWVVLGLAAATVGVSGWLVATKLVVVNNTNALIREDSPFHQNFLEYKREFQFEEDVVVTIRSEDPERNQAVAQEVGEALAGLEPLVARVLFRFDFSRLQKRFLFFLEPDELDALREEVAGYARSLRRPGMQLNVHGMLDEANRQFTDQNLRREENWKEFVPFIGQFVAMLERLADEVEGKGAPRGPARVNAVATEQTRAGLEQFEEKLRENEFIRLDGGRLVLVLAAPGPIDPKAAEPYRELVRRVREVLEPIRAAHPEVRIGLTGEPVLMDDELATSSEDSIRAGVVAFVLVSIVFLLSYREIKRPVVALTVLLGATLTSLGFAVVSVGHLNLISQAFVAMVIGLGVDFGIQIMARYEEELAKGRGVAGALEEALGHTGVAVTTGALTTAAAFFTMCFNEFIGLAEFGVVAGGGVLICWLANLVVLPAAYAALDRGTAADKLRKKAAASHWQAGRLVHAIVFRAPAAVLGVALLATVLAVEGAKRIGFDHNLLNLQDRSLESVREVHELIEGNSSIIYGIILADDLDHARRLIPQIEALESVDRVASLTDLVPENQELKLEKVRAVVRQMEGLRVTDTVSSQIDVARVRRQVRDLLARAREAEREAVKNRAAASLVGKGRMVEQAIATFQRMIPALERAERALGNLTQQELVERLTRYEREVFGAMQRSLAWLRDHGTDRGVELEDIPPELLSRFKAPSGRVLIEVYPKENIWERRANEQFVADLRSIDPKATGTPVQNLEYIEVLRSSYVEAAWWAFGAILLFVAIHFRHPGRVLLAILPLGVAILWTLGLMGWLGIKFNPANIITLPLVIGIGVAYGVYTVDRYREEGGMKIFDSSTGKAIILSALTTMIGFGSLMVSSYRGLFSLGLLMFLGVLMCLVSSLLVLPQILVLWDRRNQARGAKSR
ncbi:MAG: MMPL family transporter [Verrucomicrobiia bacterium]